MPKAIADDRRVAIWNARHFVAGSPSQPVDWLGPLQPSEWAVSRYLRTAAVETFLSIFQRFMVSSLPACRRFGVIRGRSAEPYGIVDSWTGITP